MREKEEQLTRLRAEHEALRAELAAVKEGLSSSTERAEKLLEEGQVPSPQTALPQTLVCWHFSPLSSCI